MPDQYADIAQQYKQSKLRPWRRFIEEFTLFELTGELAGKSVLDLACGEGHYTRRIRQRGAARVVGVDLSVPMIALARAEEERQPLGIDYRASDATLFDTGEPFDLVVAAYLLNYARTAEELRGMAQAVARSLKPGGRFVAVNNHLEQPIEAFADSRKYGFIKHPPEGGLREGVAITHTLFTDDGTIQFDNYYLSPQTYERELAGAGLGQVRWHAPQLSPEGAASFGRDYWEAFLARPPVYFLECVRQG